MKDAYYFSHDANAHNDPKMIALRLECGWEGIGLYWAFIEVLREIPNYKYPCSNILQSLELRLSTAQATLNKWLKASIKVGLLEEHEGYLYSEAFSRRMFEVDERRDVLSESGRRGGLSQGKARLKPPSSRKGKESKGKERKVFIEPTIEQVVEFMGNPTQANDFFDYYRSKGWTVGRSPMKDWHAAARRWKKNDYSQRLTPAQRNVSQGMEKLHEKYGGNNTKPDASGAVRKVGVHAVGSVPKQKDRT